MVRRFKSDLLHSMAGVGAAARLEALLANFPPGGDEKALMEAADGLLLAEGTLDGRQDAFQAWVALVRRSRKRIPATKESVLWADHGLPPLDGLSDAHLAQGAATWLQGKDRRRVFLADGVLEALDKRKPLPPEPWCELLRARLRLGRPNDSWHVAPPILASLLLRQADGGAAYLQRLANSSSSWERLAVADLVSQGVHREDLDGALALLKQAVQGLAPSSAETLCRFVACFPKGRATPEHEALALAQFLYDLASGSAGPDAVLAGATGLGACQGSPEASAIFEAKRRELLQARPAAHVAARHAVMDGFLQATPRIEPLLGREAPPSWRVLSYRRVAAGKLLQTGEAASILPAIDALVADAHAAWRRGERGTAMEAAYARGLQALAFEQAGRSAEAVQAARAGLPALEAAAVEGGIPDDYLADGAHILEERLTDPEGRKVARNLRLPPLRRLAAVDHARLQELAQALMAHLDDCMDTQDGSTDKVLGECLEVALAVAAMLPADDLAAFRVLRVRHVRITRNPHGALEELQSFLDSCKSFLGRDADKHLVQAVRNFAAHAAILLGMRLVEADDLRGARALHQEAESLVPLASSDVRGGLEEGLQTLKGLLPRRWPWGR